MVAFLGWVRSPSLQHSPSPALADDPTSPNLPQLTILHFGPNSSIYPFFAFDSVSTGDPYTYRLTLTASLVIWATELGSSLVARVVIWWVYELDVTNVSGSLAPAPRTPGHEEMGS